MAAESIGYAAAFLTTVSFLPQVIKVWRSRSTRDISLATYGMFTLGAALWLAYGLVIQAMPVIIANSVTVVLAAAVLVAKLRFGGG
ncbi:MAG TPA: SemiSWEET transporter [Steroidobacteraceae bacterium]|nr:SemiSWEET transporter [Steroidobacteraceae bacterium]